jgi:cysteine desulfurase
VTALYLDNNATTPVDQSVADVLNRYMSQEYGNAGSRTHSWGAEAAKAVEEARRQIASLADARPDEVIFTSGATEANNLAIVGMLEHGLASGNNHIVTTPIEHKAALEPIEYLAKRHGFEVTYLPVDERGWVEPDAVADALRPETLLVSTMHVNNETGVEQPLDDYARALTDHPAWWHVDAAQGFGKSNPPLRTKRIDLLAVTAHKIYGPKGVGALIARRRKYDRPPLSPLIFGGGQERGLRPGTLPVGLIAGFGEAARLAMTDADARRERCTKYRDAVLAGLAPLSPTINGDPRRVLPHVLNVSFEGVDAEAAMVATKDLVAISNGSACTSSTYEPSHVLTAMGLTPNRIASALRISWNHATEAGDWGSFVERLTALVK